MSLKRLRKGFFPILKVFKTRAIVLKNLNIGRHRYDTKLHKNLYYGKTNLVGFGVFELLWQNVSYKTALLNYKESTNSCIYQKR